jgi:hypothetical protein
MTRNKIKTSPQFLHPAWLKSKAQFVPKVLRGAVWNHFVLHVAWLWGSEAIQRKIIFSLDPEQAAPKKLLNRMEPLASFSLPQTPRQTKQVSERGRRRASAMAGVEALPHGARRDEPKDVTHVKLGQLHALG